MSDRAEPRDPTERATLAAAREDSENYVRVQVTKGAKEYRAETTVSLRWSGHPEDGSDQLRYLLHMADDLARDEINRREYEDTLTATQGDRS